MRRTSERGLFWFWLAVGASFAAGGGTFVAVAMGSDATKRGSARRAWRSWDMRGAGMSAVLAALAFFPDSDETVVAAAAGAGSLGTAG